MDEITKIVMAVLEEIEKTGLVKHEENGIPVGISNRHVHLSKEDLESLFGAGAKLTNIKDLSQPGQYASRETVMLVGPKGHIDGVRILGPTRDKTQIELLAQDNYKLGINAPLRISGDLSGTPGLTICGLKGCISIGEGAMIAKRHIHMTPKDAGRLKCSDNEEVRVACGGERGGILEHVTVRITEASGLDFHIDMEEANCMSLSNQDTVMIVK